MVKNCALLILIKRIKKALDVAISSVELFAAAGTHLTVVCYINNVDR